MSNLNNLTSKILEDASLKAAEIIEKAKADEATIINKKAREAQDIKKSMIDKANMEAEIRKERIISGAELKVRNEKLRAKGEVVDSVFSKALESLKDMPSDKFVNILKGYITTIDIAGDEELIVPAKYKEVASLALKDINEELKKNNKLGEIKLYDGQREVTSGFIVAKNGIEGNYTFESLLNYYRDELQGEIVKTLFS